MRMHVKLGLIFSLIALLSILMNTAFYYSYEKRAYEQRAEENLTALGEKMIRQFEDSVQVMDYTLESLIANVEFMGAMSDLAHIDRALPANQTRLMNAQSVMAGALYRNPLNKSFYRVNAFNRLGDLYCSRFDNRDTVNPLTHDMKALIANIPFLDALDARPFSRLILPPHQDPFTASNVASVFGAARPVVWMGKPVGYLEVQALDAELQQVFSGEGIGSLGVEARLPDGTLLYSDAPVRNGFTVRLASSKLGLNLTLTQGMEQWRAGVLRFAWRTILVGLLTMALAVLLINLVSRRMTRSVRSLHQRISNMSLQGDALVPVHGAAGSGEPSGDEILLLGQAFDALIQRLGASIQHEMRARELHNEARLAALQAQINPHFIYNTLNMIGGRSLEGGDVELARLTEKLAQMLRYSTDIKRKTATVAEELRHAGLYLELCKARYEDRLQYEIDVPEAMHSYVLPRLALQPLVENALLHGYEGGARNMVIRISGEPREDGFALSVRDNGDGFHGDVLASLNRALANMQSGNQAIEEADERPGVGMLNTFARLYLYSKGNMDVRLFNDGGAVIEIRFFRDAQRRVDDAV